MDEPIPLAARFRDIVTSEDEIRGATGEPHAVAVAKVVPCLDAHARRFIAASPFVLLATTNADGTAEISPKGDPAGFVRVLDDRTLAIPDRPGNRRYDTLVNLLRAPGIGLIFLIPRITYTLRVSGTGIITRDPDLRASFAVNGREPDQVLVVEVTRVLTHCPKCMMRSGLWTPEAWPDTSGIPTFAEALKAHARLAESVAEVTTNLDAAIQSSLY